MRRLLVVVLPILAVALVACSSGATPGWTYAPAPSTTPAPSGGGSGAPGASGGASSGPSAAAPSASAAAPSAEASGSATAPSQPTSSGSGATILTITAPVGAATAGFDPTELTGPANQGLTIHFDNQDNQAPHNVELKDASGSAVTLGGDTQFFQGPGARDYTVPPLQAGTYTYFCVVHPTTMHGTLTIQ